MSEDDDLPIDRRRLCEQIVDRAGEAVLFADTDGVIRLWNDAAAEIFGYSREEAIGESLNLLVPESFRDAHWQGYDEALAAGETSAPPVTRTRVPALCKDGSRIEIETSGARVLCDDDGEPVGVCNHVRAVSDAPD